MTTPRADFLARIKKLLTLAEHNDSPESQTARRLFEKQIAKHGLTEEQVRNATRERRQVHVKRGCEIIAVRVAHALGIALYQSQAGTRTLWRIQSTCTERDTFCELLAYSVAIRARKRKELAAERGRFILDARQDALRDIVRKRKGRVGIFYKLDWGHYDLKLRRPGAHMQLGVDLAEALDLVSEFVGDKSLRIYAGPVGHGAWEKFFKGFRDHEADYAEKAKARDKRLLHSYVVGHLEGMYPVPDPPCPECGSDDYHWIDDEAVYRCNACGHEVDAGEPDPDIDYVAAMLGVRDARRGLAQPDCPARAGQLPTGKE